MDIDPKHAPDIVADMLNMGDIGGFDVVYCSHSLEHLGGHEVPQALEEFRRVLKDGGFAAIFVPDLEGVSPTYDTLFEAASGPISGFDLFYGHRDLSVENPHMRHKCGFVRETLHDALTAVGFKTVKVDRLSSYNLFGVAIK